MEPRTDLNRTEYNKEYNNQDRNAWVFGWTPQAEIWNGRFAMIGFTAYLLWDLAGYSVLRDVLNLVAGSGFPR
jgi:D-alanyl-lipoteichoic acid acyltransferase DltB (MBOAT superfamily)